MPSSSPELSRWYLRIFLWTEGSAGYRLIKFLYKGGKEDLLNEPKYREFHPFSFEGIYLQALFKFCRNLNGRNNWDVTKWGHGFCGAANILKVRCKLPFYRKMLIIECPLTPVGKLIHPSGDRGICNLWHNGLLYEFFANIFLRKV